MRDFKLVPIAVKYKRSQDSREDLAGWLRSIEVAAKSDQTRGGSGGPSSSAARGGAGAKSQLASRASSAPPPELPKHLSIDGWPENGTELRVRAEGVLLDRLRPAWFSFASGSPPAADPVHDPKASMIALATKQTYTPTKAEIGKCLGCVVRGAEHPDKFRVITCPRQVQAVDESRPGIRVALRSHLHHRYCDRRLRVCDTPGRYRQGEVLEAVLRGTASGATSRDYSIRWWRSSPVPGFVLGREGSMPELEGNRGGAVAAAASGAGTGGPGAGAAAAAAQAQAHHPPPLVMSHDVVEALEWEPAEARPLTHLPPAAAPHEPAPAFELLAAPFPRGRPSRGSYPLFLGDVGRMLRCELVPRGSKGSEAAPKGSQPEGLFSNAVGPVEPATPKVREVWLEGPHMVGALLVARRWFFGGFEGATTVTWHRITPSGEDVVCKGPICLQTAGVLPDPGDDGEGRMLRPAAWVSNDGAPGLDAAEGGPGDEHPCVYRLTDADKGCNIKLRCEPRREDGLPGFQSATKPTKAIAEHADGELKVAIRAAMEASPVAFGLRVAEGEEEHPLSSGIGAAPSSRKLSLARAHAPTSPPPRRRRTSGARRTKSTRQLRPKSMDLSEEMKTLAHTSQEDPATAET